MLLKYVKHNKNLLRSISLNVVLKPCSMVVSFFYTPIVLSFLGVEQYGVWTTMLSVLNWLTIFDFGVGGGFRNLLSKTLISGSKQDIQSVTSTAYITLSSIIAIIYLILIPIFAFINWNEIFNTNVIVKPAVFLVLTFICLNFIFGLTNSILYANQKSEFVPFISFCIQLFNLIGIIILKKALDVNSRTITNMALLYTASGIIINGICIVIIWVKFRQYIPKLLYYNKDYVKSIFNYGVKLFFLQICGILLFTTDSMIITQLFSPLQVTPYSISRNLFAIINSLFTAFLAPFWSKYTIENERKNYSWIKKSFIFQFIFFVIAIFGILFLRIMFIRITRIWLGKDLDFSPLLLNMMAILITTEMFTGIFSNFLNGVGYINGQLFVSIIAAILNVPLSIVFAKYLKIGVSGVCLATVCSQLLGVIFLPIFTAKYLHKTNNIEIQERKENQ